VAPYVVKTIRRWYFGSSADLNQRVRMLIPEDAAPPPMELDTTPLPPDSAQ
jgi:hypothetical protein